MVPNGSKTAQNCRRWPQDVQHGTARAASERAQRATRAERCRCSGVSLDVLSISHIARGCPTSTRFPFTYQDRFFLSVSIEDFHQKWSLKASKLRSMLDLVLGGSWRPLGAVLGGSLGGQDAPKTAQDGAKTGQDAPKTAQDGAKTAQDGAKTAPRRPKMAPRRSQDALRCIQVGLKFKHVEIYKHIEKSKEFQRFFGRPGRS